MMQTIKQGTTTRNIFVIDLGITVETMRSIRPVNTAKAATVIGKENGTHRTATFQIWAENWEEANILTGILSKSAQIKFSDTVNLIYFDFIVVDQVDLTPYKRSGKARWLLTFKGLIQ